MQFSKISLLNPFALILAVILLTTVMGCGQNSQPGRTNGGTDGMHRFMVMDPGHFHAALVFKRPGYKTVSNDVGIYAPVDEDFQDHMARVIPFNTRADAPASWQYQIYLGPDYEKKMFADGFGDAVVLSGKNDQKMDRIKTAVDNGLNVLADKPWVIEPEKLPVLESALNEAETKGLIIHDIMTERFEITAILQRVLLAEKSIFGEVTMGSQSDPAVIKKSVHHLYKLVAGKPNKRPYWFFDVKVQGEGLVDVTTHLVDLVFWICFPGQAIDYRKDISVVSASRWPTLLNAKQFEGVTGRTSFPPQFELNDKGEFPYYSNGEFVFSVKGVHAQAQVEWRFEAPPGGGDTHYSIIKGTKANILILQEKEQKYLPELYIQAASGTDNEALGTSLTAFIDKIAGETYPGLSISKYKDMWQVNVPDKYRVGHEAHFGQVTDAFLEYLDGKPDPLWEKPNMLAKYYVTTKALELCRAGK